MPSKPKIKMMSDKKEDENGGSSEHEIEGIGDAFKDWKRANIEAMDGMSKKDKFGYREWLQHKQRM